MPHPPAARPPRRLGAFTATLVVVASMVGTGVFTTTGFLVRDLKTLSAVVTVWAIGGLGAMCGALGYAELASALPHNGGEYQMLSRIYHPAVGFVSGWASLVVGFSAPMAASALAFGTYVEVLAPFLSPRWTSLALIAAMSLVHAVHVTTGGRIQNVFTLSKVTLIGVFIVGGLWVADLDRVVADRAELPRALVSPEFAVALVYVSFAYTGWNAATYIAGEVRRPERTVPVALISGTLLVTLLYLALNTIFVASAPVAELSGAVEVGHVAAIHLFGPRAGRLLTVVISLGLVSTVSAIVMTGPRVYEAMGRDHPALASLSVRRGARGPVRAIVLQGVLAAIMVVTATFDALLAYIGVTLALFSGLTVFGVFILRKKEPELPRPYRTWGYPFTPILFIALMIWMIVHTMVERPAVLLSGLATLAVGAALYGWGAARRTDSQRRQTSVAND